MPHRTSEFFRSPSKSRSWRSRGWPAIGILAIAFSASVAFAQEPLPAISVASGAGEEVVYDWSEEHCETWDIPDAPIRMFRDHAGRVIAFATHHTNRLLVGTNVDSLRHPCDVAYEGRHSADPADHSDRSWIAATWTENGRDIVALLHSEYHADTHPGACMFATRMACWYNVVTAAFSADGGRSFSTLVVPAVVAAPTFRQDVGQGRHRGFFNPSNIIEHEGFYYTLIVTTGGEGQPPGTCLFRTADVFDARSWRAWDGNGFTVRSIDPYRESPDRARFCKPLKNLRTFVGSVTRHDESGKFVAILHLGPDPAYPGGRVAYSWSLDLRDWSSPQTIVAHATMWSRSCGDKVRYAYASLIDPHSPRRNFDSVGNSAYLYMTRFNVENCAISANRDLVRLKVAIALQRR